LFRGSGTGFKALLVGIDLGRDVGL